MDGNGKQGGTGVWLSSFPYGGFWKWVIPQLTNVGILSHGLPG